MPLRPTALRYVARFACTMEKCPDTCCSGMRIMLTADDQRRLTESLGSTDEGRARLSGAVETMADPKGEYAAVLRTDGGCRLLCSDKLCAVHRDHGAAALPAACAQYPRVPSYFSDRTELAATLGCPEAARLCLTAEDGLDVVDAPGLLAPGAPLAEGTGYAAAADEVHAAVGEVLRDRHLPVALRLALVAELGRRTADHFHASSASVDRPALSSALQAIRTDEVARAVAEKLTGAVWPCPSALQAVMGLFASLPENAPPRAHLIAQVMNEYMVEAKAAYPALGTPSGPPFWDVLWERAQVRRQHLHTSLGGALEPYYGRFLINDWHREWYTQSPSLLAHAFKLAVRVSAVMLLCTGHPALYRTPTPGREEIEAVVVDAVQVYSRYVERSPEVLDALEELIRPEAMGQDAFGRVATFARLAV